MNTYIKLLLCFLTASFVCSLSAQPVKINRKAVVNRHNVKNTNIDSLGSLTVGNGTFAFTVDITGVQSFPEYYKNGVSLGTQSEWGWNTFPNKEKYTFSETLKSYDFNNEGRDAKYSVPDKELKRIEASEYFRVNPHRLQLGNVGLELYLKNGQRATIQDIKEIRQTLDLWTGVITSEFKIEGHAVKVFTAAYQQSDRIGVKVISPLIDQKRIKVFIHYPFPTGKFLDEAVNYENEKNHISTITSGTSQSALINHQFPGTQYFTSVNFSEGDFYGTKKHYFVYEPSSSLKQFEFTVAFSETNKFLSSEGLYKSAAGESVKEWSRFWNSGAAVDFEGSTDPRAFELERRIILSQYLTKVQCGGSNPPQETGLTFNSWYGKPHTEMHWWHGVHYALWGRPEILEKTLNYYFRTYSKAKALAERQGYKGVRWIKMSDNNGNESPSSVAAFLIWEQPHLIYMTELLYRDQQDKRVLEKYKELVFATAEFMADFAFYDKVNRRYNLGKGIIPAQEVFKAAETINPTYELAYWDWALRTAQKWKERLGAPRVAKWDDVINKLAPLPVQDNVYLATESATDSYTFPKWMTDHPAVLGALGMVPESPKLDKRIMRNTLDTVLAKWSWKDTWGWDFPMTAMNAARLNLPDKALDALFMNIKTNTYLKNGHNYQDSRLRIYLPGNGGVLAAVAMMLEGWDTSKGNTPGFPNNGSWKIKKEGFKKMP